MKKLLLKTCLLSALTGCATQVPYGASGPGADESMFVVGVSDSKYRVTVIPGSIKDGKFSSSFWKNPVVHGEPKDGFLVGQASAGEVLGITTVTVIDRANPIMGMPRYIGAFTACGEQKMLVFTVPRGKVVYLANLNFDFRDNRLYFRQSSDLEAARSFFSNKFPLVKTEMVQAEVQTIQNDRACVTSTGPIVIPVYIPSYR